MTVTDSAASSMVGKRVRFIGQKHATPILVTAATRDGMIELEGWVGVFAPQLFVVVEEANG